MRKGDNDGRIRIARDSAMGVMDRRAGVNSIGPNIGPNDEIK